MADFSYIKNNVEAVLGKLAEIAGGQGRDVPTLVAVTKSATDEEVLALAALGIRDMAENRPQMLAARQDLLMNAGYTDVRMHEIGNLQTNKVRLVLPRAHLIHSLGSDRLAEEMEREAEKLGMKVPVLLEINSGCEESKGGIYPVDALAFASWISDFQHLSLRGVMTMAPVVADPEEERPYFRLTRELFEKIGEKVGYDTENPILSMGMSDSYAVAAEEGSTLVRVGRRLFMKEEETYHV